MPTDDLNSSYDVVVVGGGAAGLNGALMLARSRRSVVVIDAGQPRNAPADGVHGLLARDGMPPAELLERGRAEVRSYGGAVVAGDGDHHRPADRPASPYGSPTAGPSPPDGCWSPPGSSTSSRRSPGCASAGAETSSTARTATAGRCATGRSACSRAARWWRTRLCSSASSATDVTVFSHTVELTAQDRERLLARDIRIIDGAVAGLRIDDDRITGGRPGRRHRRPRDVVTVSPEPSPEPAS